MKRSCEKISQLSSEQLDRKLDLKERFSMWVHFLMCSACRHYSLNMLKLHQVFQLEWKEKMSDVELPIYKRKMIEQSIKNLKEHKE
ncbi:MAG: hypothetical protein R8M14_03375 [Ghiorsea sp.]